MTSEIGRILKCLTSKSYHSLQDDAYTHVHLIPEAEVVPDLHSTPESGENQGELISNQEGKGKIRRPRSAGDLSETLHQYTTALAVTVAGGVSTFPGGSSDLPEGDNIVSSTAFSRAANASIISSSSSSSSSGVITESNNNHHQNSSDSSGGSSSSSSSNNGGILSFFGYKFKSNTRHLDRSGCHQQSQGLDCGGVLVAGKAGSGATTGSLSANNINNNTGSVSSGGGDVRYTKFPLSYGKNTIIVNTGSGGAQCTNVAAAAAGGGRGNKKKCGNGKGNEVTKSQSVCGPMSLSSVSRNKSKLCRSLDSPQQSVDAGAGTSSSCSNSSNLVQRIPSDLPFEESQIHFTPLTKTYGHPHKSPVPPNRQNLLASPAASSSSSSGNFITNTVSSIGRKVVNSVTPSSKSKHNKSKLKVKSKSDNSLHRVNSNVNVNSVLAACSNSAGGIPVPRNASASTFSSFDSIGSGNSERRLNSVQLGDHATIRLPWTGFQQINNLSSVSSTRAFIPNTHNNNLDSDTSSSNTERYVECGSNLLRSSLSPNCAPRGAPNVPGSTTVLHTQSGAGGSSRIIVTRRRSRSLERCSNFRVFPVSSSVVSSNSNNPHGAPGNSSFNQTHHSWRADLDIHTGSILSRSQSRKEPGSEKEKQRTRSAHSLERNTSYKVRHLLTPTEQQILLRNLDFNQPPQRPEKPAKVGVGVLPQARTPSFVGSRKNQQQQHPRHFEKLHRSAPNSSFSNSSESGESSYSAPPSPPPRPPSTLKPESRLIIQHPSSLSSSSVLRHHHQQYSTSGSDVTMSMHSIPASRRPVAPTTGARSLGSSSDSGVSHSHMNSSTSTLRGTSDFSDESAGSVNISQHSSSQHSGSATTSSSGVSHSHHTTSSSSVNSSNNTTPLSSSSPAVATTATNATTGTAGISLEDVRNSGFINKPLQGWLHSDQMLSKDGAAYTVRYIGCLDVNTSMKSLDFDTRSLIAKECINQVCEAAGLRSQDKKRKIDRRVAPILGIRPRLDHAGSDVRLTITSTCLKLTSLDTGTVIAVHDMPNISFASGGDATMLDFVAYVAKDSTVGRACFVLECGSGLAQDVITTVGQAFELRFKEYLQKRPPPPRVPMDDPEYYNDLPGKVPPDIQTGESKDKIQNVAGKGKNASATRAKEPPPLNLHSTSDKELSVNLIDFEAPTPPAFGPSVEDKQLDSFLLPGTDHPSGANNLSVGASGGAHSTGLGLPNSPSQPQPKDPFDMQPFATTLPPSIPADIVESQRKLLEMEHWFHGTVGRSEAEDLMKHDGDFLVRESMACPGQFVLTGVQGGSPKHLLLVDPEGVVRTKDRTFDNVIHLIRYHCDNHLPIISAESMVLLRNPVPRVISS